MSSIKTINIEQIMVPQDEPNLSENGIEVLICNLEDAESYSIQKESADRLRNDDKIILFIGILPLIIEEEKTILKSLQRADSIRQCVDVCILLNKEHFRGENNLNHVEINSQIDCKIYEIVQSLRDILKEGKPGIDLETVKDALRDCGTLVLTRGVGIGRDRVDSAFNQAYKVPLYDKFDPDSAQNIIIKVLVSNQSQLSAEESSKLQRHISSLPKRSNIVVGVGYKELKSDQMEIVILRTGVDFILNL